MKQFPSMILSQVAKFISFVAGGFAATLLIIALLDESLLEAHVCSLFLSMAFLKLKIKGNIGIPIK